MSQSSRAIVIAHDDFGEADRYVKFYTQKWGMISALAKSARKSKRRYVGGLDLFCHNEIFLRGDPKATPYLVELSVLNSFTGIRDHLDRLLTAGKTTQWVRKLADTASPNPGIYSLLGQTLALIEKESDPARFEIILLVFRLKLLSLLGLKPRVDACSSCGEAFQSDNRTPKMFDLEAGGALCAQCARKAHPVESMLLGEDERQFIGLGDRIRLTAIHEINFPGDKTLSLTRLVTRFASFHNHVSLPI